MKINPKFKNMIPDLSPEEYRLLEQSILEDGCRDALVAWKDTVVDGHNRHEICTKHGVAYETVEMNFEDETEAIIWIIRNQFGRRNLSPYQRGELALELEKYLRPAAQARQAEGGKTKVPLNSAEAGEVREQVAKAAGVGHDTISRIKKIQENATPEVKEALRKGETTINKEYKALTVHVGHNSGENEWYTPETIIEAARAVMGGIDCDPASSEIANRTVKAKKYFTVDKDGLIQKWNGRVWMNPPYAQPLISQFSKAAIEKRGEYNEALILVNNATETEWCQNLLKICSSVCFIKGRIKFIDMNGKASGAPLQGQVIIYIGENKDKFCEVFSDFGLVFENVV